MRAGAVLRFASEHQGSTLLRRSFDAFCSDELRRRRAPTLDGPAPTELRRSTHASSDAAPTRWLRRASTPTFAPTRRSSDASRAPTPPAPTSSDVDEAPTRRSSDGDGLHSSMLNHFDHEWGGSSGCPFGLPFPDPDPDPTATELRRRRAIWAPTCFDAFFALASTQLRRSLLRRSSQAGCRSCQGGEALAPCPAAASAGPG